MKELYLVRHAKSSWSFDLPDHDRPLGVRGRKDVRRMGNWLAENIPCPDLLITSTANRALYTALHLADSWGYREEGIILTRKLYHASPHAILEVLYEHDSFGRVAVFGHNPGFTDFYNRHAENYLENIPTCGIVGLRFDIKSWKIQPEVKGKTLFFQAPKNI